MVIFRRNYFLLTIILLLIEVLIAIFVDDRFVRPYFGDFLVVILLYCFLRSFFRVKVLPTALGVLLFAFMVETTQYFRLIEYIGFQHSGIVRAFIGGSFDWSDLLAYTLGIIAVIYIEKQL